MIFQNYCTPHLPYSQQLFEIFISPYFKIIVFHYFFLYILSEVIALNGFERVKEKKKRAIKEAAFVLFSERGFNEVKIEHIAKEETFLKLQFIIISEVKMRYLGSLYKNLSYLNFNIIKSLQKKNYLFMI